MRYMYWVIIVFFFSGFDWCLSAQGDHREGHLCHPPAPPQTLQSQPHLPVWVHGSASRLCQLHSSRAQVFQPKCQSVRGREKQLHRTKLPTLHSLSTRCRDYHGHYREFYDRRRVLLEESLQLHKPGQDFAEADKVEALSDGDAGRISVGTDSQASVEGATPNDATVHTQTIEGKIIIVTMHLYL